MSRSQALALCFLMIGAAATSFAEDKLDRIAVAPVDVLLGGALMAAGLFLLWWKAPGSRMPAVLLLVLGMLHLLGGGIISVIPFKFLPYYPEQSVQHYLAHIVYGVAQLPLIIAMIRQIRQSPRSA